MTQFGWDEEQIAIFQCRLILGFQSIDEFRDYHRQSKDRNR